MRLGPQNYVAANAATAGQDIYNTLMAPASPVPPSFMHVCDLSGSRYAVPVSQAANFHAQPPYPHPVPNNETAFQAAKAVVRARADREAVEVHQRGYAITDATSTKPLLSTSAIAPCIAVVVHASNTATSALGHVDADMNAASIANMIGEFSPGAPLDLYFHGGLATSIESPRTCVDLLQALHAHEGGNQRFTVRQFDVVTRPHSSLFIFDSATATLTPDFSGGVPRYDSAFRTLTDGSYLAGTATAMAGTCEAMAASPQPSVQAAGRAARNLRKQFDARPDKIVGFLATVEKCLYAGIANTAVQRAGKGSAGAVNEAITAVLRPAKVVDLVEANYRTYLSSDSATAGDRTYLAEVLISALLHGDDIAAATKTWLASAR